MKCRCPACGRTTSVPPDLLHFLTRCDRCSTLLKPFIQNDADDPARSGLSAKVASPGRYRDEQNLPRLPLAQLLTRAPASPAESPIASVAPPMAESREKALRRAELRGHHQILGTLSLLGALTLGIVSLAALGLKLLPLPQRASGEILHMHDAPPPAHAPFPR